MANFDLIATATFGLEAVVKREIQNLGYQVTRTEDTKITFQGDESAIVKSNLWLRCADRVLLKMGEAKVFSFTELFDWIKNLPWTDWIPVDGKFTVVGTSIKSQLHSVPDCQKIIKKAIVEKLKEKYAVDYFQETGPEYLVRFGLLKDTITISIDTSGSGLHKRGYRMYDVSAPIKETLAAAMIQLSFWNEDRVLLDPFCGSGTIPIEAAMIAKNIAPGLMRSFVSEEWPQIPPSLWEKAREEAHHIIDKKKKLKIFASDINGRAIYAARENAIKAGLEEDILFQKHPLSALDIKEPYAIMITNPPYGQRLGDQDDLTQIYSELNHLFQENPTWSLYLITADKLFEKNFIKAADRRRKLYNGRLETTFYQYYGPKPPLTQESE